MLIIHFYLLDNLSLLSRKWPEKHNIFCARVPIIDLRDALISGASRVFERAILNKRVLTLLNWLVRPYWNILVSVFCSFSFSVCNDQYFPKTHLTLTEQTILTFTLYMKRARLGLEVKRTAMVSRVSVICFFLFQDFIWWTHAEVAEGNWMLKLISRRTQAKSKSWEHLCEYSSFNNKKAEYEELLSN